MPQNHDPPLTEISPSAQRTILLYSVLAGLCPLIPVPFLDGIVLGLINRRMIRVLLGLKGLSASDTNVQRLSRERAGCTLSWLYSVALAPVKKLVRTLVFVLAFKDCVDAASRWLHRGYLVAVALEKGHLDEETLARPDGVWPVALAIEESIMKIDTSPINQLVWQAFTQSRSLLRTAARDLARRLRRVRGEGAAATEAVEAAAQAEGHTLSSVIDEISSGFWAMTGYLSQLEALFSERLPQTTSRMLTRADAGGGTHPP